MSDIVLVALFGAIVGPTIATVIAAWLRRGDKRQDWARQDQVAERLLAAQAKTTRATERVAVAAKTANEATAAQLTAIEDQGKQIHILVNSDMTAARQSELTMARALLALLRKVGDDPEAVTIAEDRVSELELILADRLEAQTKVEAAMTAQGAES